MGLILLATVDFAAGRPKAGTEKAHRARALLEGDPRDHAETYLQALETLLDLAADADEFDRVGRKGLVGPAPSGSRGSERADPAPVPAAKASPACRAFFGPTDPSSPPGRSSVT